MTTPNSLARDISPPPTRKPSDIKTLSAEIITTGNEYQNETTRAQGPSLASIEAGEAGIRNHLEYFSQHLHQTSRQTTSQVPRILIEQFRDLYKRNQYPHGRHFVIHQHDHPVSGVHYDLRLQFSETSTISFAIPYGLPGNPNSLRPNRMAIETRVHNLWNNLIESASHATGSLLIWDTGEYEVLPYREIRKARMTDDEASDDDDGTEDEESPLSESEKLFTGFQSRRLRLRLHGTKLPEGYTIGLRLPSANDRSRQPEKPQRKRRKVDPAKTKQRPAAPPSTDSENDSGPDNVRLADNPRSKDNGGNADTEIQDAGAASEAEDEDEDAAIRSNNAYTGATNTIGSIHQRHWFLSLDRKNSGFQKVRSGTDRGHWVGGSTFFVLGRDDERSVVSGRSADEVMADEGVAMFQGRKMWRPITE